MTDQRKALLTILDNLVRMPPRVLFHTAWLGSVLLALGNIDPSTLSQPMQLWFATLGGNALFELIKRVSSGESVSATVITNTVQKALAESKIENLLSQDDLRAELFRVGDGLRPVIQQALDNSYLEVARLLMGETDRILDELRQSNMVLHNRLTSEFEALHRAIAKLKPSVSIVQSEAIGIRQLRVFISSPGDVPEERQLAAQVVQNMNFDGEFKGKFFLEPLRWDDPNGTLPMPANETAQKSVNRYLVKPSDTDIVVVIFWSKMGTPLLMDGREYLSGTHYEFMEALEGAERNDGKPTIWVYRSTRDPIINLNEDGWQRKVEQYQKVKDFFATFNDEHGRILRNYSAYQTPEDFREVFESQLRIHLRYLLTIPIKEKPRQAQREIELPTWQGSPFPGLRAFTEQEAPIFFGRGRETDQLVKMVSQSRFVAVVGASGSGKSSLVGTGLIPRLRENAIEGSKDWYIVRCTPGEQPFVNLAKALITTVPALAGDPIEIATRAEKLATILQSAPDNLDKTLTHALQAAPDWSQVLLFVDQFEELLTLTPEAQREPFANMLTQVSVKVRMVVTMRADFYHRMLRYLEVPLRDGSFTLYKPSPIALYEMIVRPAERAGLVFEDGLAERIVRDTGDEPGALALMAYLLDELYNVDDDKRLTHKEYENLGGVAKAIGIRAENVFKALSGEEVANEQILWRVFRELVEVDERGIATRRRISFNPDKEAEAVKAMIYAFADARLLTTNQTTDGATVEVAHEALLREWDRLANWILQKQDDLRLIRQFERDAEQWQQRGMPEDLQPKHEQLVYVDAALERLDMRRDELSDLLRKYTEPEQVRLLAKIAVLPTSHRERQVIGDRLADIGDYRKGVGLRENAVPQMEWLPVEIPKELQGKSISFKDENGKEFGQFELEPFFIAKYLVTYQQFQAFIEAEDGFQNEKWWAEMPKLYVRQKMADQLTKSSNNPRDSLSWYQAVAFSRWLTEQYRGETLAHPNGGQFEIGINAVIRLPLGWEWQWAAQGGIEQRKYPWGEWQEGYANTSEAGLGRAIGVGLYPQGVAKCGALDMAGNLWEWCLNDYEEVHTVDYKNSKNNTQYGGAFNGNMSRATCTYRSYSPSASRNNLDGARMVVSYPVP